MPVLFNKSTGLAENLGENEAQQALNSNTHEVPLIDQQGQIGSASRDEAQQAIQAGYSQPSPEQLQGALNHAKYGTGVQRALGDIEAFGEGVAPVISTAMEVGAGVPKQDILQRREQGGDFEHGTAQTLGLAASNLIPGYGEYADATKAAIDAKAAVKMGTLTEDAAKPILEKASSSINPLSNQSVVSGLANKVVPSGTSFTSKIGSLAAKGAIEGSLIQGEDEATKALLTDAPFSAESAVTNMGMAGLIGLGVGGTFGTLHPLWESTIGQKLGNKLAETANEAKSAEFSGALTDAAKPNALTNDIGILKPNSDELQASFDALGIKPTIGALSDKRWVQEMEAGLARAATIPGQMQAKETTAVFDRLANISERTLKDAEPISENEGGKQIRNGLNDNINEELKPAQNAYKELQPTFEKIDVNPNRIQQATDAVLSNKGIQVATESAEAGLAARIGREMTNIKNIDDIKTYRTKINGELDEAYRSGSPKAEILQTAKDQLTSMRESAIQDAADSIGIGKKGANEISSDTIQKIRDADKNYALVKQKARDTAQALGLSSKGSLKGLLDDLKVSNESFAKRVFNPDNIERAGFFKENYPKEFELARKMKLQEIKDNSINHAMGKNGRFETDRYLRQFRNLSPEARRLILGPSADGLRDIENVYQAMPGEPNPSGTAHTLRNSHLFSIEGVADNASDAVKYAVLKGLPHIQTAVGSDSSKAVGLATSKALADNKPVRAGAFKNSVDFITHSLKGETLMSKATKAIFKGGMDVLPEKLIPDNKSREKLDKRLETLRDDPSPLFKVGGDAGHYLPDHAAALGNLASNAVTYLNSLRPQTQKLSPLDSEIKPNSMQTSAYNRALDIAQSPMLVMKSIKDGTLTPDDIKTMATIYPRSYPMLQQKLMQEIANHTDKDETIPYKTRMSLALFMAQPLDSTMTPGAIQAIQATSLTAPQPGMPQQGRKGSMAHIGDLAKDTATPGQAREAERSQKG